MALKKCGLPDCNKKPALIVGDCKYCKISYCGTHRLPELHDCKNLHDCKRKHFDENKEKLESEQCKAAKIEVI